MQVLQGGVDGGFRDTPLVLGGKEPNTMTGAWQVKCGRLTLAKDPGVDAVGGTIVVGSMFIGLNLLSDVLYRTLDPRTRER